MCAGKELIYVAWPHQPLNSPGLSGRLGIVYCVNRACALHCSTVSGGSQAGSQVGALVSCHLDLRSPMEALLSSLWHFGRNSCSSPLIEYLTDLSQGMQQSYFYVQEQQSVCLTPSLNSALSPTFTPDGESILFLSHSAAATSGVHNATAALCTIPWPCESLILSWFRCKESW